MSQPSKIDIKAIVEDFLRTATSAEMLEALHESDPSGVLASFSFPILDAQPKRLAFTFFPEHAGAIVRVDLANWGTYRSPAQRKWDNRLAELPLAA